MTGLDPATGLFEQFAGFHALEPLDLAAYRDITVPIDVVIGRERTRHAQVVKQADVVALLALLPEEFPGAMAETNFRHYEPRCAHGSSLSAGFHALVAARLGDPDMALRYLREAAALDLDPDPTSAGGVRMAGLGGVWQAVVLGFAGLDLTGDVLGSTRGSRPSGGACRSACTGGDGRAGRHRRRRGAGDAGGGRGRWRCGSSAAHTSWRRARRRGGL